MLCHFNPLETKIKIKIIYLITINSKLLQDFPFKLFFLFFFLLRIIFRTFHIFSTKITTIIQINSITCQQMSFNLRQMCGTTCKKQRNDYRKCSYFLTFSKSSKKASDFFQKHDLFLDH